MSVGPERKEKIEPSVLEKVGSVVSKTINLYFQDVFKYSFSVIIFLAIIGLFLGMKFSLPFYFILVILFSIELYRTFWRLESAKELKDKK